jgi:hypothetical protein
MQPRKILASFFVLGLAAAFAQPGIGAKYGSRDPQTCDSTKEPTKGAPSVDQIRKYLPCHMEGTFNGGLYLIDDVNVQIGKGIPYATFDILARPGDADPASVIYPIRGSFKKYQCFQAKDYPAGQNCTVYAEPKASGICWRTTFGDWTCNMSGGGSTVITPKMPPPPRR